MASGIKDKTYLAKGKRGIAYTGVLGAKKVLLKEWNPSADVNTIANEAEVLKTVNRIGVGPEFISLDDGVLVREFIDGPEFPDWIPTARKDSVKKAIIEILDQCERLDSIGINKLEMNHPQKHILMRGGRADPVMIDFDRSRRSERPKNVTQVCQWLTSGSMAPLFEKKMISLDRQKILDVARRYKESYSRSEYRKIKEMVRDA